MGNIRQTLVSDLHQPKTARAGPRAVWLFSWLVWAMALAVRAEGFQPWREFSQLSTNLAGPCLSVQMGGNGNLLSIHPPGAALAGNTNGTVSLFDGYQVTTVPLPEPGTKLVAESPGSQLWAVVAAGLARYRPDETNWETYPLPEIVAARARVLALHPLRQDRVLVLLADRLLQVELGGNGRPQAQIVRRADDAPLGAFTGLTPARDGGLWLAGERGVAFLPGPLRQVRPGDPWRDLLPPEGLQLRAFRFLQTGAGDACTALATLPEKGTVLASWNGRAWQTRDLPVAEVRFAWRSPGRTWLVSAGALWEWRDGERAARPGGSAHMGQIVDVAPEGAGAFWLATTRGPWRYTPGIWSDVASNSVPPFGGSAAPNALPPMPEEIAEHAAWKTSLITKYGDVWLGGAQDIAWRHRDGWRIFSSTNAMGPEEIVAFAEAPDGRVWCATPGKIWTFDGADWFGLRGGFEGINALHCARNGTLWVATQDGLHRYTRGAWLANGVEDGLPSPVVTGVQEDEGGRIFARTDAGVSVWTPEADAEPPLTIMQVAFTGDSFGEGETATLHFEGRDKWLHSGQLLFSHRLDEREWSPFLEGRSVAFSALALGKHYFQVRAMDRNGNLDARPARWEFTVVAPWYRETRLVFILAVALAVAVFFAALAFNRHRQLALSYAGVERKIAERTQELERAHRELLHSQKMNALGTLAAGIAHDFNNILSIIKGSAQIIEENLTEDAPKVRTRLERIKTVVHQGAGIVEAMLGFSRNSTETAGPYAANAIVEDTLKLLGDRFLREIEVRFERGEGLPEVVVTRDFVQQVLLNFIFNAAEAMGERKQLTLRTRLVRALPAGVVLPPAKAEGYLVMAVEDCGAGISPENLPRIFEPFFTTKALSARRGTGLGLSMAYELARKLDAGLAVETEWGKGSVFSLLLPVTSRPGSAAQP